MTREWTTLASAFERRVLRWAMSQLGAAYVWAGKGDVRFDAQKGLRPWTAAEVRPGRRVYDCSGLVTCALRETTAVDVRARWAASTMRDATKEWANAALLHATLRFYGRSGVDHVAFGFPSRGAWDDTVLVLEAAGAGSDALTEQLGREKGAAVQYRDDRRTDLVASVPLWALGVAAGAVPRPTT
jgi:hypothetical protein